MRSKYPWYIDDDFNIVKTALKVFGINKSEFKVIKS